MIVGEIELTDINTFVLVRIRPRYCQIILSISFVLDAAWSPLQIRRQLPCMPNCDAVVGFWGWVTEKSTVVSTACSPSCAYYRRKSSGIPAHNAIHERGGGGLRLLLLSKDNSMVHCTISRSI